MISDDVSDAVVEFLGFKRLPVPLGGGEARLVSRFGVLRAESLTKAVKAIVAEMNKIPVDWGRLGLAQAGDMVRQEMKDRHPELSESALNALVWKFTYDWR